MEIKRPKLKKIKWGVAGCGRITEKSFLPAIHSLKRSQLTSVYSSNFNRAKAIANRCILAEPFDDFDKFLKHDFEIVYIASENHNHYQQVIKAANAGKNILCEKPMALNSEQAREMIEVAKKNNVYLGVNYIFRYHPLIKKGKELIENSLIGKIISISCNFNIDIQPSDNYRFDKTKGGGALFDLGTHMIDMLRYFGGEICEIKGFIDNVVYKSQVDDFATAVVKFEKGFYGQFNVSFNAKKANNRIDIIGHKGSISFEDVIGRPSGNSKLIIDIAGEGRKVFRKKSNRFLSMMKQVQKSTIKKQKFLATGEDGLQNIILMEKLLNDANS